MNLMNKTRTVFLTGATGLIGSYLMIKLLQADFVVYAFGRKKDNLNAKERIGRILEFWNIDLLNKIKNLHIVEGDLTKKDLGLSKKRLYSLADEVDEIFHCAAVINYNLSLEEIRKVNVFGTKKILDFAISCKEKSGFRKVNYLSTAYVCGNYKGIFREDDLDVNQQFNTPYEESKFEAEKLIHAYRNRGLWIDIFRPAIVVGESKTGKIFGFEKHFYQILHVLNLGIFDCFPVKESFANIVPVDEVSESIVTISCNSLEKNRTYHLFRSGRISLLRVLDYYKGLLGMEKPIAVYRNQLSSKLFSPAQKIILKNLFFSFNSDVNLDSEMTERALRENGFSFSEINEDLLYRIFEYLIQINYFKNSDLSSKYFRKMIG